jgi:gliding motility-associated-like protein
VSLKSQSLPVVDFGFTGQCSGKIVEFTNLSYALSGEIMVFIWDFGDGKTSNAINPMHIYENSGSYTVKLTVIDDQGRFSYHQKPFQIFTSPEFILPGSISACNEETIRIDPLTIFADSVKWTINGTLISDSSIFSFTANDSIKSFVLQLTASNSNCSLSEKINVQINEKPTYNYLKSGFCENEETTIQIDIEEPQNYNYEILLNDSLISSDRYFNSSLRPGTHSLEFLVADKNTGCQTEKSDSIEIFKMPELQIDIPKTCRGDTSVFRVSTFEPANNYTWTSNFSIAEGEYYQQLFEYPGWYDVKIEVVDSIGCKNDRIVNHEVFYQPEAKFQANNFCISDTLEIINESEMTSGVMEYFWLFDSTNFSTEKNPEVWFSESGIHRIDLRVTSENNCVDTQSKTIKIDTIPEAGVIIADSGICSNSTSILSLEGHQGNIEFWEKSSHNIGIWSRINHSESELEINDSKSTDYRVWVSNGLCKALPTPLKTISPSQPVVAGKIIGELVVCSDDDSLKYKLSGYVGNNTEWQISPDSTQNWSLISNYSEILRMKNPGYSFKLRAIVSNGVCDPDTTEVIEVKYRRSPSKGIIKAPVSLCENEDSIQISLSDYDGEIVSWQGKLELSNSWESIGNSGDSIKVKPTSNTSFRAEISGKECGTIFSDSVTIEIKESGMAGRITFSDSSFCVGDTVIAELQNFKGNVQWQISDDSVSWSALADQLSRISVDTLSTSKYFRTIAEQNDCLADTSEFYFLKVNARPKVNFEGSGFCENESIQILMDNESKSELTWFLNDSLITLNGDEIQVDAGFHDLILVAKEANCSTEIIKSFFVYDVPEMELEDIEKCNGSEVSFSIYNGSPTWYLDSTFYSEANSITVLLEDTSVHNLGLKIDYQNGCSDSIHSKLKGLPIPEPSLSAKDICEGEKLDIEISSKNNTIDQWYLDNEMIEESLLRDSIFDHSSSHSLKIVRINSYGCSNEMSTQFNVNDVPDASFLVPVKCLLDTLNLSYFDVDTNSASVWSLNDSQIEGQYIFKFDGSYVLKSVVENEFGCKNSHAERFEINTLPSPDFDVKNVCQNDSILTIATSADNMVQFNWYWNDTLISSSKELKHQADHAGDNYLKLRVSDSNNCKSELEKEIRVHPTPNVYFDVDDVCLYETAEIKLNSDSINNQNLSYQWKFGDGQFSLDKNPTVNYQEAGLYSIKLTVENEFGCINTTEDNIQVNSLPDADFEVFNTCLGDNTIFTNTSQSSNYIYTSNWKIGGDFSSTKYSFDTVFTNAGQYEVLLRIVDENGCVDSLKREIEINRNPELIVTDTVFEISKGETVQLKIEGAENYIWQPSVNVSDPFGPYVEITPTSSTRYSVTGKNSNGCSSIQSIYFSVEEDFQLRPQNILTPNQDGINDFWRIENIENYDNVSVVLFDGSGRRVYQNQDYQNNWDGSFGRDFLPDGTYYYMVSSQDFSNVYRGALTLIRGR